MAVYFQPQYKPWWADLANTALKEGLSGLMKGMFERDAAARTKNRYNKEWAQAWEGYGGPPTGAQTSAQQPSAMSIESAPEVRGIGQIANPASMQSATGNDALGAALKTQGITVPKEYLPNGNDGLLGTSIKANLANNYVQSQMPSREEFIRRLGMVMSPQNMELALKQADYMMGPRWKVDDQIYKGRQLENVLGTLPGMQDKEGNRNYNNRAYMYGLDNAANGNLNFLNPEYKRWFDEAENERKRAFDARENALTRNAQMAIHRMNNAAAMQRAQLMYGVKGAAGAGKTPGGFDAAKAASLYLKALGKIGEGMTPEEYALMNQNIDDMYKENAGAVKSYLGNQRSIVNTTEGGNTLMNNPYRALWEKEIDGTLQPQATPQNYTVPAEVASRNPKITQQQYNAIIAQGLREGHTIDEINKLLLD